MEKRGDIKVLLNNHHIKILRFILNSKDKLNVNRIAKHITQEQTKTKELVSYLNKCGLIILDESNTNPKRYKIYLINNKIPAIKTILNIFEKFAK